MLEEQFSNIVGDVKLKGTPVSKGKVVGRVCVAPFLEDAINIKV